MEDLKEIRKKLGYSQLEVAQKVGISQNSYSNIENDVRRPSIKTAKKIAKVLDFEWTLFFNKDD